MTTTTPTTMTTTTTTTTTTTLTFSTDQSVLKTQNGSTPMCVPPSFWILGLERYLVKRYLWQASYPSTARFKIFSKTLCAKRALPMSSHIVLISSTQWHAKAILSHSTTHSWSESLTVDALPALRTAIACRNRILSINRTCFLSLVLRIGFHLWLPRALASLGSPISNQRGSSSRAFEKAAGRQLRINNWEHWRECNAGCCFLNP